MINFQGEYCVVYEGFLISRQAQSIVKQKKGLGHSQELFIHSRSDHSLSNHCGPNMYLAFGVKGEIGNGPSEVGFTRQLQ